MSKFNNSSFGNANENENEGDWIDVATQNHNNSSVAPKDNDTWITLPSTSTLSTVTATENDNENDIDNENDWIIVEGKTANNDLELRRAFQNLIGGKNSLTLPQWEQNFQEFKALHARFSAKKMLWRYTRQDLVELFGKPATRAPITPTPTPTRIRTPDLTPLLLRDYSPVRSSASPPDLSRPNLDACMRELYGKDGAPIDPINNNNSRHADSQEPDGSEPRAPPASSVRPKDRFGGMGFW
jgi:hypothetical protein